MVIEDNNNTVNFWSVDDNLMYSEKSVQGDSIVNVDLSPDGITIAIATFYDITIRLFSVDGELLHNLLERFMKGEDILASE